MNEHLKISANGIRLLTDYEKGPDDGTVPLTPNGAALAPYVCPGGELTIGYGCTKWFDGEDVEIHHRLSGEEEARELLDIQMDKYEAAVRQHTRRPLTQNQFDGFVALCFNIGVDAFAYTCSALDEFNDNGRVEDAAANFGKWTGSTCERPPKWLYNNAKHAEDYKNKMAKDHKGHWRWVGPDGQYCRYMLRYEGLLWRHYSEALMFMDRDWPRARAEFELTLTPTHPDKAVWNAKKNRWQDEVEFRTSFKDVLAFAWNDPLPTPQTPQKAPQSVSAAGGELLLEGGVQIPNTVRTAQGPAEPVAGAGSPGATQPFGGPAAPKPSPQPSSAASVGVVPSAAGEKEAPAKPTAPPAPSAPAGTVKAGTEGTKAPSPYSVKPNAVPYRIDPEAGLKPLETSDRAKGYVWQQIGRGFIRAGAAGWFGTGSAGAFQAVDKDGIMLEVALSLFVPAAVSTSSLAVGYVTKTYGDWKRARGQREASQGLY